MTVEQLIALIIQLIGGVLGMPFTQWLKSKLGLDGTSALALSFAVSVVLAVAALFVTGALGFQDFSWETLPGTVSIVWATATLVYNGLRGRVK